jgi:transposase
MRPNPRQQTPRVHVAALGEGGMLDMMKRHEIQVLRRAGHSVEDVAGKTGASTRTVIRVSKEAPVSSSDTATEVERRRVGRPSTVEKCRPLVEQLVSEEDSEGNPLRSKEILRRVRQKGFKCGKSALYALVASLRPDDDVRPVVRFEGLPGEFCQHDFGQVIVKFEGGRTKRIRFFASRLKYSRYARVTIVDDERTETLVRCVVQHYDEMEGVPLLGVFDRPSTVAIAWRKDGTVTQWNQTFVEVMLDIGVGVEVCWPASGNQKGSVERLVGWVKGSFFKQRTFIDDADLQEQLEEWLVEINEQTPSRATNIIPLERKRE